MFHLDPLYTAVAWVLLRWHQALTAIGLPYDSGVTWTLAICLLVITVRLLLFRLFLSQVRHQRKLSALQPQLTAIRIKYRDDRAAQQRELVKLRQAQGFNPLSGCLPMLLQIPVFISLVQVLRHVANSVSRPVGDPRNALYGFTPHQTLSAAHAHLLGAPLALTGASAVVVVVVLISATATYLTQRLIQSASPVAAEGTVAAVQRLMRFAAPLSVVGSALFFPLGVLLYWCTSNLWTLGQQLYVERFHPRPARPRRVTPISQRQAGARKATPSWRRSVRRAG